MKVGLGLTFSLFSGIALAELGTSTTTNTISQIYTACDPLLASTCSPDLALATGLSIDLEKSSGLFDTLSPEKISFNKHGASLQVTGDTDNPFLILKNYIMYGKIEASIKAATGNGIISHLQLHSDDFDMIEFYILGSSNKTHTFFEVKGAFSGEYDESFVLDFDPRTDYHKYAIEWTENEIIWSVDGNSVRSVTKDQFGKYPQSPMQPFIGITQLTNYDDGVINYSHSPFTMYVANMIIVDYSKASKYQYNSNATSIDALDGSINEREDTAKEEYQSFIKSANGTNDLNPSYRGLISVLLLLISFFI